MALRRPHFSSGISDYAVDALRIMDSLGLEKAVVVGESFGGMVAQQLAIAHEERLLALVLCNTMDRPMAMAPEARTPTAILPVATMPTAVSPAAKRPHWKPSPVLTIGTPWNMTLLLGRFSFALSRPFPFTAITPSGYSVPPRDTDQAVK
ncbi:MAG: alpha/beta hydrolase [Actinobacteria bacterium]|nr:alpha/beta hydrolase [Actinomycetota bacterium]MBU4386776.1 alpha/beta hydrolase [Actinomycetota bacterium]MBU4490721.1 alpha/beta hydrolase [Actinomycetota bacterium]